MLTPVGGGEGGDASGPGWFALLANNPNKLFSNFHKSSALLVSVSPIYSQQLA